MNATIISPKFNVIKTLSGNMNNFNDRLTDDVKVGIRINTIDDTSDDTGSDIRESIRDNLRNEMRNGIRGKRRDEIRGEIRNRSGIIDVSALKTSENRKISNTMINPAEESIKYEIAEDHAAEPIKDIDDIERISDFLIRNERYRDNMLFIVGINFGLRISDLRVLRFGNLISDNFFFKESFPVFEKKTRNTRKKKKNRYITINNAVIEAVTLYLEHTPGVSLSDYMFRSESNRGGNKNKPLTVWSINRILQSIADDLGISAKMSTHTLRKTFCYHQMLMSHNDPRKLMLLQKMLNHASPAQTLDYIGITQEEIEKAYQSLNLGGSDCYALLDSDIIEFDCTAC